MRERRKLGNHEKAIGDDLDALRHGLGTFLAKGDMKPTILHIYN